MPESELAAKPQATALATFLESARTPHELTDYRARLTPRELDAPEAETEALALEPRSMTWVGCGASRCAGATVSAG